MFTAFRQLFTERDNVTFDLGRALWALSWLAFLLFEAYHVIGQHKDFDPIAFSGGVAAILAAGAASLGLKANTEHQ